jgi:hypothetical protein
LENTAKEYMTTHHKSNLDAVGMSIQKLIKPSATRKCRTMQVRLAVLGIDKKAHTKHNILEECHNKQENPSSNPLTAVTGWGMV